MCILQTLMRSHPMGLDVWFFGQTLRLLPDFMCSNSEGFAGLLCDKYHNLVRWLRYCLSEYQFYNLLNL